MIILIDKKKKSIQHKLIPFLDKNTNKLETEGNFLKLVKSIYEKPTANIILNDEILDTFPLKSGTRQGRLFSFQNCTGDSSQGKEIKCISTVKKEVKLSVFTDDKILYIKNPTESSKKQGELVREFIEVPGHKINLQKSIVFVYTYNEKLENRLDIYGSMK